MGGYHSVYVVWVSLEDQQDNGSEQIDDSVGKFSASTRTWDIFTAPGGTISKVY